MDEFETIFIKSSNIIIAVPPETTATIEATTSTAETKPTELTTALPAPAQDKLRETIACVNEQIVSFTCIQQTVGLSIEHKKLVQDLMVKKSKAEKSLKRKQLDQKAQQRSREKKANVLRDLQKEHPEAAEKLMKLQVQPRKLGRPAVEESMHGLHTAILSIVIPESGADERRRSEVFNSVRSLDDLKDALEKRGYLLSRTALYYRLIPANTHHVDGKRHVNTVPVKLSRPQSDMRKTHVDGHFAMASVKYAWELASLFSSENVFFLSQDDKARVPLGLPVSKKQTAILMHLEYKVSLPDHDFPIGEQHKLVPSVYASCLQNKDRVIGYSGPTYISIRSAKHDKSGAASHMEDFQSLIR